MCVVILAGERQNPAVETGVDFTQELHGNIEDADFFKNNFGDRKAFIGGPECLFRGKKVPCFIR